MENTGIEWTDSTFNPWHGCMKVSPGCTNCYAEAQDRRFGPSHWGPGSDRKPMSEKYWTQPQRWNEEAKQSGKVHRVFCASMADVFEGHKQTLEHLSRLFDLIIATPYLTWQLLTKRPENILGLVPKSWRELFPSNVWMGTSAENQEELEKRIEHLIHVPAHVLYLSCEPLLGPLTLPVDVNDGAGFVDWIIAGGESGPRARPMHPDWVRSLRDQCQVTGTAFFFKQWGEYLPFCQSDGDNGVTFGTKRFFRSPHNEDKENIYYKLGKKISGSMLDGKHHKDFPEFV